MREGKQREEDIELVLKHLEYTGKMVTSEVKVGNEDTRLVKLATIKGKTPVISEKEKAMFALEENISAIEAKVSEI